MLLTQVLFQFEFVGFIQKLSDAIQLSSLVCLMMSLLSLNFLLNNKWKNSTEQSEIELFLIASIQTVSLSERQNQIIEKIQYLQ
jgi:hypothetical protein